MNRIKALIGIGLLSIVVLVINACCDEGYSYKWHNVILQNYANDELAATNTIKQNEYRLRVHLISSKSEEAGIYIPKLTNYAYANDCMGAYLNIDKVSDIDIVLHTYVNGSKKIEIMTYYFDAILDENTGEKVATFDLPDWLNRENSKPIEYFDLVLNEYFENDISGKLVEAVNLADKRSLSDTTETLKLKL